MKTITAILFSLVICVSVQSMEEKRVIGSVELLPYIKIGLQSDALIFYSDKSQNESPRKKRRVKKNDKNKPLVMVHVRSNDSTNWHEQGIQGLKSNVFPEYLPWELLCKKKEGEFVLFKIKQCNKRKKKRKRSKKKKGYEVVPVELKVSYKPIGEDPETFEVWKKLFDNRIKQLQKKQKKKKRKSKKKKNNRVSNQTNSDSGKIDWNEILALFNQGLTLSRIGIYEVDIPEDHRADFGLLASAEGQAQTEETETGKHPVQNFADGIPMEVVSEDEEFNDLDLNGDYEADTEEDEFSSLDLQDEYGEEVWFSSGESD